jgi:hypothetical protein
MMGYDASAVKTLYDPSIFESLGEPRYFFTGSLFFTGSFTKTKFDTPEIIGMMRDIK